MTGASPNHLKFNLTSVKTQLAVRNIIIFSLEVMTQSEVSFDYRIHLSPVNVQSKQNSQRDVKITKNVFIYVYLDFCKAG